MSEEERIYEIAKLEASLRGVPIKIVIAIVLCIMMAHISLTSDDEIWEKVLGVLLSIVLGISIYGMCSTIAFFSRMWSNWILGFITSIILLLGVEYIGTKSEGRVQILFATVVAIIMMYGGVVTDIRRIINLKKLRNMRQ